MNFQPNGVAAARSTSAGARYDRLLIVNEHHLRQVLAEYLRHYKTAWPNRTLGQLAQAGTRPPQINLTDHRIRRKQVLGGLTSEYQIAA